MCLSACVNRGYVFKCVLIVTADLKCALYIHVPLTPHRAVLESLDPTVQRANEEYP